LVEFACGEHVTWIDVAVTWDEVIRAGFDEPLLPGCARFATTRAKAFERSAIRSGSIILPAMGYQFPGDDGPPDRWRPEFEIAQDGRVRHGEDVVFDPSAQGGDHGRLRTCLKKLAEATKRRALVEHRAIDGVERAVASPEVLILADRWVEWSHVQRVLRACSEGEVLFLRQDLAVGYADQPDAEAEFMKRSRGK
jgi:hypothetical protein